MESEGYNFFKGFFKDKLKIFECQKEPGANELRSAFNGSPPGVKAFFSAMEEHGPGVGSNKKLPFFSRSYQCGSGDEPACLESAELESCSEYDACDVIRQCVRRFVSRLAAGWSWNP